MSKNDDSQNLEDTPGSSRRDVLALSLAVATFGISLGVSSLPAAAAATLKIKMRNKTENAPGNPKAAVNRGGPKFTGEKPVDYRRKK